VDPEGNVVKKEAQRNKDHELRKNPTPHEVKSLNS